MRSTFATAVVAGVIGLVVVGIYLGLIIAEGETNVGVVVAFSTWVFASSLAALVGGLATGLSVRVRRNLLVVATLAFAAAGVLGIFSVGLPLLIAAVLSGVASARIGSLDRETTTRP